MDAKILLGKILQRFKDARTFGVKGYNSFGYIRETDNAVIVSREKGKNTSVPFKRIITGIETYQNEPELYMKGPMALRAFGITHVTSPVWAMLHLMNQEAYHT